MLLLPTLPADGSPPESVRIILAYTDTGTTGVTTIDTIRRLRLFDLNLPQNENLLPTADLPWASGPCPGLLCPNWPALDADPGRVDPLPPFGPSAGTLAWGENAPVLQL